MKDKKKEEKLHENMTNILQGLVLKSYNDIYLKRNNTFLKEKKEIIYQTFHKCIYYYIY